MDRSTLLEDVEAHCDLADRLNATPDVAGWRGMYFSAIEKALAMRGRLADYRALSPKRYAAIRMYPLRELIENAALGSALLASPAAVRDGLLEIGRYNAEAFLGSALGRAVLRRLASDPYRLMEQSLAGRRLTTNYGRWWLTRTAENSATMHFADEYVWIDSYLLGAGMGTFEAAGVTARFEVELDDPFNGRHVVTW